MRTPLCRRSCTRARVVEPASVLWRDAPGFFQRFTGTFSDDGTRITGRCEASEDGSTWEPDFDVTYTKVR
jgi:hypothetical protein